MEHNRVRRPAVAQLPQQAKPQAAKWTPSRASYARAVGSFVPRLTRKVFEKFGFSTATLITEWAEIVGADIAQWSEPERLKWPRLPANADVADEARRPSATLVLRVDPARALDVEYRRRQIVERINGYFGYRAVGDLRIVQAPLTPRQNPRDVLARKPSAPVQPSPELVAIADEPLKAALARLQANLAKR